MKKLLMIFILLTSMCMWSLNLQAQTDSTSVATDSTSATADSSILNADNWKTELTLASRNVFRGVSYGESPSIMMKGAWLPCKWAEVGVYGNMTMNGVKEGYGNQINYYITIKPFVNAKNELKNISITSDDYFYFNADDNLNNYFAWSENKTNHFLEARLKYDSRLDFTVAYTYHANKNANVDGIYFEAGYDLSETFNVFAGYLTDQNDMMFQNKGGWTNIGGTVTKPLHVGSYSPVLKVSLIASPMYETHQDYPGVGKNPISLVAALTF